MKNPQETNQPNQNPNHSDSTPQTNPFPIQSKQNIFSFLKSEPKPLTSPPFFSENGLSQDIINVTDAEPDLCLEVFYALCNTLWPQIEKQSNQSLKDAWTNFIGVPSLKGVLCPPEKLIGKKRLQDIMHSVAEGGKESDVFQDLDQVVKSILELKNRLAHYSKEISQYKEILASLDLLEGVYLEYRKKFLTLAKTILEKNQMNISSISECHSLENLLEPKAVIMSDIFTHHWAYRIPRNKAQKVLSLDENRRPLENYSNEPAAHRVTALPEKKEAPEPLAYFKANGRTPIQPEKEFMLYSLYRQLQIPVPETALLILTDVFEESSDSFYAVQASEAVIGEPALQACKNKETVFEQETYVSQVIGALLTNPFDGSFKNFKYSPRYKTLVSIDNDLVFEPELTGNDRQIVNIKSVLYLLPQMDKPIPASVRTYFTTLDPLLLTLAWLHDLQRKNEEYKLLFARLSYQKTRNVYQSLLPESPNPSFIKEIQQPIKVDPELHYNKAFYPHISISKSLLKDITRKLERIETTLLNNRSVTSQTLFEETSPIVGKYYGKFRKKFQDLKISQETLWGFRVNNVNYSHISFLLNDGDELESLAINKVILNDDDDLQDCEPEELVKECKEGLASEQTPLDRLIRRHNERKMKDLLNLQEVLREFQLLKREHMTDSKSFRDVVDFCSDICRVTEQQEIVQEIVSILFSLPHVELQWLLTLEKYFLRIENSSLDSSALKVHGAFMRRRIFNLTESEKSYLFDSQGKIKKHTSLTGRSNVTCFPRKDPQFYLKQYPELPGYEFASVLFMRLLGVTRLPYQELMIVDSKYPLLLTQAIDGAPAFQVWQYPEAFSNLDPFHTHLLIISAMLLNPEDGKEDNYLLSRDGRYLIPIDSDHCFLPSTFKKEGSFWNAFTVNIALQTKTLLFCLDEMKKPIPNEVKQHILGINFDFLLQSWFRELVKVEDRYNNLVGQEQRNAFLENGTVLRIPFYEQFVHNLYEKVNKIQDLLRSTSEQTPFGLLKAVEPFAARCYQESFQHGNTLESRFKAATKELYVDCKNEINTSRISALNAQSMMKMINISEKDLQNDATYNKMGPLDALELLKQLILKRSQNRKREQDLLSEFEDKSKESTWTTLFGDPVLEKNLKEFFLNPKGGLLLRGSKLITRSNLTSLLAQAPDQGTKIRFLSFPDSPLLDSKTIRTLVEGCPNLEYLNISGCVKLEEIETWKGEWPLLARLEVKECLNLKKLISSSPIKVLRVGTHQKIEILIEKSTLDSFTIVTQANQFDFLLEKGDNFEIAPLEKEGESTDDFLFSALLHKEVFNKYFRNPKITVGTHSILSPQDLESFITSLDLTTQEITPETFKRIVQLKLINLKKLLLPTFKAFRISILEELIKGHWPKLTQLDLSGNEIADEGLVILSRGKWPLLEILTLNNATITRKGFLNFALKTNWHSLKEITYSEIWDLGSYSPSLLLRNNGHLLVQLRLSSSKITQREIEAIVKMSNWPNLKYLNLSSNPLGDEGLETLLKGNWPLIELVDLERTKISSTGIKAIVDANKWPNLNKLNLSFNEITDKGLEILSQGNWPFLSILYLEKVLITSASLEAIVKRSNWPNLKKLNLSSNPLEDEGLAILSQKNWLQLEKLNLARTRVTNKGLLHLYMNLKWPKLQGIALSSCVDTDLASSLRLGEFSQVKRLDLNSLKMAVSEIVLIVNRYQFQGLKYLNLSNNEILDEGISVLNLANWPLLEELYLDNTNITSKGISALVNQSLWQQLKSLDISNNEIFDEGLEVFALGEWPLLQDLLIKNIKITQEGIKTLVNKLKYINLRKLDISENDIFDEGLKILASAKWPLLQHLIYCDTKVTLQGNIALLKNMEWPYLDYLEHSFTESFYNYNKNQDKWTLAAEIVLATVSTNDKAMPLLVAVLDLTWLDSKEIYLLIKESPFNQRIMILPRNKLDQLESIKLV